jgi:Na+:H+ antiporter, NhaB family
MSKTYRQAIRLNFLGETPGWYKLAVVGFLLLNPLLVVMLGKFAAGWIIVLEFIFALAMALQCYPLPPGGLIALEAIVLGLATPGAVYREVAANLPVILLLVFMVAGIYFLRDLLQYLFSGILLGVRSKVLLSLIFCSASAFLSAFLDALTEIAMVVAVAYGFYEIYQRFLSGAEGGVEHDLPEEVRHEEAEQFRGFLRNLLMHAAVGTALGGVMTLVGEPQNLLIAQKMGWSFSEFFTRVAPVSIPVFFTGAATCVLLERLQIFGYGYHLSDQARSILSAHAVKEAGNRSSEDRVRLVTQGAVGCLLIVSLAFHLAEAGLIGLMVIVLATAMNGVTSEHRIGKAFEEGLPFTALLVVFLVVVTVIHEQHLFEPVVNFVLSLDGKSQLAAYYLANGLLSTISDNVFVATVYMAETASAFAAGRLSAEQYNLLAVTINTGTNIPSIATPNGQAAFLFLLTSSIAPLIRLSYGCMVKLALPYTLTMSAAGLLATWLFL